MFMKFLSHPIVLFAYKCYDFVALTMTAAICGYLLGTYILTEIAMAG